MKDNFNMASNLLTLNDPSTSIDFNAASLNIPRPLAELRQSGERFGFGNASFAANLVAGMGAINRIGDMGPGISGPGFQPGMGLN